MTPFLRHTGRACQLMLDDIDTDVILPTAALLLPSPDEMAEHLFAPLRERTPAQVGLSAVFDATDSRGASFLLVGANFGCGSSREMAVWALAAYGFRCIVAPSFNEMFRGNCVRNGLLPVCLDAGLIDNAVSAVARRPHTRFSVDLETQRIVWTDTGGHPFAISRVERDRLVTGVDEISETLRYRALLEAADAAHRQAFAWAYRADHASFP